MFLVGWINPAGYFSLCINLGKREFAKGRAHYNGIFLYYFLFNCFIRKPFFLSFSLHFQILPLLPISENSLTECKPANRNCLLGWKFCFKYIKDSLPVLTRKSGTFISPFITFIMSDWERFPLEHGKMDEGGSKEEIQLHCKDISSVLIHLYEKYPHLV